MHGGDDPAAPTVLSSGDVWSRVSRRWDRRVNVSLTTSEVPASPIRPARQYPSARATGEPLEPSGSGPAAGRLVRGCSYRSNMSDQRVRVDEATIRTCAEIALQIRTASHIVHTVTAPRSGSAFAATDDLYP